MRQWEAGDPIEGGNDTGIPDTKYFDYLKGGSDDDDYIPSRDDSSYFDDSYERRYEALVLKARELSGQGMYGEAVRYYEAALEIISYDRNLLAEMAECCLKSGNASKAGKCYYELGSGIKYRDNEKALEYFKKAFEIDSSNPSYGFCLGTILEDMGRYREAIGYLKKAEANWHVANCHMELKEYSEAISYLDKCIDENHLRDDFAEQKFECLMHQGTAKAIDFYFERCDALMKMGYYFEAVRYLDRILEVQSSNSRAAGLKEKYLSDARTARLYSILDAAWGIECNTVTADREDLKSIMDDISRRSGESIGDILDFLKERHAGDYDFHKLFDICIGSYNVNLILEMY